MLAGHFTTALVAKQQDPRGHIGYFLVASQLPDLLWLVFHYLGLEPTEPHNMMDASLDALDVHMTYSHDLLPMFGWIALTIVVGKMLFGEWRTGLIGGLLVVIHAVTDYLGGFPHNVFGPETTLVGTGLYDTAPYLAVALEGVFTVAVMVWVFRKDRALGVQRSRGTYIAWAAVFGGGLAFMFSTADLSMVELLGLEEASPALANTTVPLLATTYLSMVAALVWADRGSTVEPAARVAH